MINKIYFKFKTHPGDFFRNDQIWELPNPNNNLEDYLICFLNNYQSDRRISYMDDLSKLIHNEFDDKLEEAKFIKQFGNKNNTEILKEINVIENELKAEASTNFYALLLSNKIEIIVNEEKK